MEWPNGLLTSNIFDDIQIEITDLRDSGLSFLYFNPLFEKTALIFWTLTANQQTLFSFQTVKLKIGCFNHQFSYFIQVAPTSHLKLRPTRH